MASTFTFGFSGDDIDADVDDGSEYVNDEMQLDITEDFQLEREQHPELLLPRIHSLDEIVRMSFPFRCVKMFISLETGAFLLFSLPTT